jgi:acyl homoserine lactone synthase
MTIACFNYETAHLYDDALASQFHLRHRVFIERQSYDVPSWRGMEYDQFDTPATQYFVWRDEQGKARGVARLAPTSVKYMLEEVWPEQVTGIALPKTDRVWEGTRFGVDRDLPAHQRNAIVKELVCAYIEYAILNDIEDIIGVMPVGIWRAVFARNGWKCKEIGPIWREDGIEVVAARLPCTVDVLQNVRRRTQMSDVLHMEGAPQRQAEPLKAA